MRQSKRSSWSLDCNFTVSIYIRYDVYEKEISKRTSFSDQSTKPLIRLVKLHH